MSGVPLMLHQYGAWLIRLSINQDTVNAGFKRLYSAVGTEIFEVPQKHPSSSRVTTSPQHTRQLSVSAARLFSGHFSSFLLAIIIQYSRVCDRQRDTHTIRLLYTLERYGLDTAFGTWHISLGCWLWRSTGGLSLSTHW